MQTHMVLSMMMLDHIPYFPSLSNYHSHRSGASCNLDINITFPVFHKDPSLSPSSFIHGHMTMFFLEKGKHMSSLCWFSKQHSP